METQGEICFKDSWFQTKISSDVPVMSADQFTEKKKKTPLENLNTLLCSCLQIFLIKNPFDSLAIWPEPKKSS